jgi:hypothetical protein
LLIRNWRIGGDMRWLRLDPEGKFSSPHTGEQLSLPPEGTILQAIRGHASEDPPKGYFIHVGDGKFVPITPTTKNEDHLTLLDAHGLYVAGRAVVNNGFAFFLEHDGLLNNN